VYALDANLINFYAAMVILALNVLERHGSITLQNRMPRHYRIPRQKFLKD
jgi:hypothetical protein